MQCINCKQNLYYPGQEVRISCAGCAIKYRINAVGGQIRLWLDGGSNCLVSAQSEITGEFLSPNLPKRLIFPVDEWQLHRIQLQKQEVSHA